MTGVQTCALPIFPATIYGGEVLNLSAAGAGKIEVRKDGTLQTTLNLDANFQTTYTVPVGASGIFKFTFVPDTSIPSPNGVLKVGSLDANVTIVDNGITHGTDYTFPNTTGTVNVNFQVAANSTDSYQVYITDGTKRINIDTITGTVTKSIDVPVGTWTLVVSKITASKSASIQFSVNSQILSSYADEAKLPDVSMTMDGNAVHLGDKIAFNAFETKDLVITAPEGYSVSVNITSSDNNWDVSGTGKTVTVLNDGSANDATITVTLTPASGYALVKIDADDNADVYSGDKKLNHGCYYAIPTNGGVRVKAAQAGYTVTDVLVYTGTGMESNQSNGANIDPDTRDVVVPKLNANNTKIEAFADETKYYYDIWGVIHACVVIGEGAKGTYSWNVRLLKTDELKADAFTATNNATAVGPEKIKLLDYVSEHPSEMNHEFYKAGAGFFKLHLTCTMQTDGTCSNGTNLSEADLSNLKFTYNGKTLEERSSTLPAPTTP